MRPYADHFSRLAPAYAACRPGYPEELFTYLAGVAPGRELAWDCAAGSGQATVPLARRFRRVVGTDISAAMLDQAPRHPNIEYRVAPAEKSSLPDAAADLVTAAQALHWLDPNTFYREAARVLAPAGVLAVWTYGNQELDEPELDRVLRRFYADVVGPYWPPERCHVESGYRTLPFPFSELDSPAFTMVEHWSLPQLLGYVGTWSASQRFRETTGHDPVALLEQDLLPDWGSPDTGRRICWPLTLRVGSPGS